MINSARIENCDSREWSISALEGKKTKSSHKPLKDNHTQNKAPNPPVFFIYAGWTVLQLIALANAYDSNVLLKDELENTAYTDSKDIFMRRECCQTTLELAAFLMKVLCVNQGMIINISLSHFDWFFLIFELKSCKSMWKTWKKEILTSNWSAKHPKPNQNIVHTHPHPLLFFHYN